MNLVHVFQDIKHFGFLTVEQALADFVDVVYELKNYTKQGSSDSNAKFKSSEERYNPVIVFGGSYGAELAALMRMKYPAVVEG